jgi:hypothetical protein
MDILISWSGTLSKTVANAVATLIQEAVPGTHPWVSANDLTAGTRWFESLMDELERAQGCVICLTQESLNSSWVYFEAGAIAATNRHSLICPYLIGLEGTELAGSPLSHFQWARCDEEGTLKLVHAVNEALGQGEPKWPTRLIDASFRENWLTFAHKLNSTIGSSSQSQEPPLDDILPPRR